MRVRRTTTTSNFGVGAREGHDASAFYDRFRAPELSSDDRVLHPESVPEPFIHGYEVEAGREPIIRTERLGQPGRPTG